MSVINKAYARGVAESLMSSGLLKVASVEAAIKIADHVGSQMVVDPLEGISPAHTTEIAQAIMKTAMETGSLITGDKPDQQNTPMNAASQVGALGAMDEQERPQETYHEGAGQTSQPTEMVGLEMKHPKSPGKTDGGANSVNKAASLKEIIRSVVNKQAADTGSLITGDKSDQQNTPANAASQVGGLGALDEKQRPQGTHHTGVGKTELDVTPGAIGQEMKHPKAPGKTDGGSNSVKSMSKQSAFNQLFELTAQDVLPELPQGLNEAQKVAAIKKVMVLDENEKVAFLKDFRENTVKVAESLGLPFPLKDKKDDEDKEEKKEDKKDKEKEAAANVTMSDVAHLLSEVSKIASLANRQ